VLEGIWVFSIVTITGNNAVCVDIEKETKALRKKMKRQEIANRAAEKELAEISLEQQVLRELRSKQTQKQTPGEPQVMSQAPMSQMSTATSVTDLMTTTASSTVAVCAKSQPAIATSWASDKENSQARFIFFYNY